jgi:hypothetical protein
MHHGVTAAHNTLDSMTQDSGSIMQHVHPQVRQEIVTPEYIQVVVYDHMTRRKS